MIAESVHFAGSKKADEQNDVNYSDGSHDDTGFDADFDPFATDAA